MRILCLQREESYPKVKCCTTKINQAQSSEHFLINKILFGFLFFFDSSGTVEGSFLNI